MSKRKSEKKAGPKLKKQKAAREDFVVFAFRLRPEDRDLIHKAAGPAQATRFVLSAALAASNGDNSAFEELTAQAKANLK